MSLNQADKQDISSLVHLRHTPDDQDTTNMLLKRRKGPLTLPHMDITSDATKMEYLSMWLFVQADTVFVVVRRARPTYSQHHAVPIVCIIILSFCLAVCWLK